jgi:hypothetical protein
LPACLAVVRPHRLRALPSALGAAQAAAPLLARRARRRLEVRWAVCFLRVVEEFTVQGFRLGLPACLTAVPPRRPGALLSALVAARAAGLRLARPARRRLEVRWAVCFLRVVKVFRVQGFRFGLPAFLAAVRPRRPRALLSALVAARAAGLRLARRARQRLEVRLEVWA